MASGSGGNDRDVAIEAGNFLKELEVRATWRRTLP